MANQFTSNPMTLDTAWTSGTVPAGLTSKASPVEAYQILFTAAAAGDSFTITDLNGNVLITFKATAAGSNVAHSNAKRAVKLPMGGRWILSAITATDSLQIFY